MAVVLYQRAQPRHKQWLPLLSQQIRLRNITQIVLLNPLQRKENLQVYFTLHVSLFSAPFFTSGKVVVAPVTLWDEIQVSLCSARLSAKGCVVRIWSAPQGEALLSWGVHFQGLHYVGNIEEWNPSLFTANTIVFCTPYGAFTSLTSLVVPPVEPQRFLQLTSDIQDVRSSYTIKNLLVLHGYQRSLLEEHDRGEKLKLEIAVHGYSVESVDSTLKNPQLLSERLIQRERVGKRKLRLKEEIEALKIKINSLVEEKGRAEGRICRIKTETSSLEGLNIDLVSKIHDFKRERTSLHERKASIAQKGQNLGKYRSAVFIRRKQLISELLQIYPLALVGGSQRYSINGVQLPNAEEYTNESGGQISVALGYTAHLVAMIAFFLGIPCRYPIRHFGSRSRIIDHITVQIPDKEREFPLYFKGKKDVYCAYAVYLLNKNIAQLRWFCALSTPELKNSLPNLMELLERKLVIPGWPPSLGEALELAQEITEDIDAQFLTENTEITRSLDGGLDKMLEDGTVEPYLKEAFSEENPGGNSAALGDIQHGRGQERFLSGWKKKTYIETDDFDPKWLLDSMNLDFDTTRRFSTSSPPQRQPLIHISEDSSHSTRRRRMGQVEAPPLSSLARESSNITTTTSTSKENHPEKIDSNTPSKDIIQLEKDIKEFERRRSRGANIPYSKDLNASNGSLISALSASNNLIVPSLPDDNWVTDEEKYNDNRDSLHVKHTEACSTGYHIPPPIVKSPCDEEKLFTPGKSDALAEKHLCSQEANILKPTNDGTDIEGLSTDKKEYLLTMTSSSKEIGSLQSSDCDRNKSKDKCEPMMDRDTTGEEDSSLWIRTEALMDAPSFNLVRRRMSTSEST